MDAIAAHHYICGRACVVFEMYADYVAIFLQFSAFAVQ